MQKRKLFLPLSTVQLYLLLLNLYKFYLNIFIIDIKKDVAGPFFYIRKILSKKFCRKKRLRFTESDHFVVLNKMVGFALSIVQARSEKVALVLSYNTGSEK